MIIRLNLLRTGNVRIIGEDSIRGCVFAEEVGMVSVQFLAIFFQVVQDFFCVPLLGER